MYERLCLVVRAVITFLLLQLKGNVFNLTGMSKTSNVELHAVAEPETPAAAGDSKASHEYQVFL